MKWALASIFAVGFVSLAQAQSLSLEQAMVGDYRARGVFAPGPDKPQERLACNLNGVERDTFSFHLSGRCASANSTGDMQIDIIVTMPGHSYTAQVRFNGDDLGGFDDTYQYAGIALDDEVKFTSAVEIEGRHYRSEFSIQWDLAGIVKIVETVRSEMGNKESTLVHLDVRKR